MKGAKPKFTIDLSAPICISATDASLRLRGSVMPRGSIEEIMKNKYGIAVFAYVKGKEKGEDVLRPVFLERDIVEAAAKKPDAPTDPRDAEIAKLSMQMASLQEQLNKITGANP